jgi:hypothetical protein
VVTAQFEAFGSEWRCVPVDPPWMIRFTYGFCIPGVQARTAKQDDQEEDGEHDEAMEE